MSIPQPAAPAFGPTMFGSLDRDHEIRSLALLAGGVLLLAAAYCDFFLDLFGGTSADKFGAFGYLWNYWQSPQYSHGFLIPLFSIAYWWTRYRPIPKEVAPLDRWIGVAIVAACMLVRPPLAEFNYQWREAATFIPALAGVFLIVGGRSLISWTWPGLLFLIFMYNIPGEMSRIVFYNLQRIATVLSGYTLQTLGFDTYWEVNRIHIGNHELGVVDACSGLRMLTIFVAFSIAMVMFVKRPWWEQAVIVLSSVPIALAVNVFRITVTGIMYALDFDSEIANKVFHDFAGWVMIPMAFALLYVELLILQNLFIEEEASQVAPLGVGRRPASAN